MRLDQLQLILDLAQTHSFNQTAERHYTTQQSVSYSIKQLEKELNTKIFYRSKNGVSFTPEGKYVLQCAQQMNEAYQQLLQNLGKEAESGAPPKKISVVTSSVLVSDIMARIINAFNQAYSGTKLRIREMPNEAVVPALLSGACDLAIWSINLRYLEKNFPPQETEKISFRLILEDRSIAALSAASPLARQATLSFEDISHAPKSIFGLLPVDFFGKSTDAYISYANNNPDIHKQLMLENNTICFTSELLFRHFFAGEQFVERPFEYHTFPNYHLILRRKETQHTIFDSVEEIVIQQFMRIKSKPNVEAEQTAAQFSRAGQAAGTDFRQDAPDSQAGPAAREVLRLPDEEIEQEGAQFSGGLLP